MNKKRLLLALTLTLLLVSCDWGRTSSSSTSSSSSSEVTLSSLSEEEPVSSEPLEVYKLTFNTNGGTAIRAVTAPAGAAITEPTPPIKAGFLFDGWYRDNDIWSKPFVFDVMPNYNLTIYAKWNILSGDEIRDYENSLEAISKPNHLYIHYLRFNNSPAEYSGWDIWIWPANKTGRIVDFVKNEDGTVYTDPYGGAMIEINLSETYFDGGHDGHGNQTTEEVSFMPSGTLVSKIGFLITYKSSRTAGTHWTSDGGDKFLTTSEALAVGYNDSLHVFAVQDNVRDFTYKYAGETFENPYLNDDGTNVSLKYNDVNSSGVATNIAAMSPKLRDLGVGYQIMVSSFADSDGDGFGDIRGIINNFDYFRNLNVESLWLTPVQLSDSYHGYDIIDYLAIDPKFGSKTSPHAVNGEVTLASAHADYLDLLAVAESHNITVVMDLVINHTSINNVLFQESISLEPEYRAYYHWRNHQNETLDYKVWHPYSTYNYSFYGKFASSMPELNFDYQKTRDKIYEIMDYWVNSGVGGFRIDAVKHAYMEEEIIPSAGDVIIADYDDATNQSYASNLTKNIHLFKELNARLKAEHPNVFMVGENFDGHSYRVAPYYEGLDSMLNFYMFYNISNAVRTGDEGNGKGRAAVISGAVGHNGDNFTPGGGTNVRYGGAWNYRGQLETMNKYQNNGNGFHDVSNAKLEIKATDSLFTSNHDLPRAVNRVTGNLSGNEITSRNNISISNRAKAEKMALAHNAATILLPGLSWIYYGDELGMSSNLPSGYTETSPHADRFARQPFKWDKTGSNESTTGYSFSGGSTYYVEWDTDNLSLNGVAEQSENSSSMLRKTQELTALKNLDVFKKGSIYFFNEVHGNLHHFNNDRNVFAFERELNGIKYQVFINMSNHTVPLSGITWNEVLSIQGASKTSLPAWGVLVVKE